MDIIKKTLAVLFIIILPFFMVPLSNNVLYQLYLTTNFKYDNKAENSSLSTLLEKSNVDFNDYIFMDNKYTQKVDELCSKHYNESESFSIVNVFDNARKRAELDLQLRFTEEQLKELNCTLEPISKLKALNLIADFKDLKCYANIKLKEVVGIDDVESILLFGKNDVNFVAVKYSSEVYCIYRASNAAWNISPLDVSWRVIIHSEAIDIDDYDSFIRMLPYATYANGFLASHGVYTLYLCEYTAILTVEVILFFIIRKCRANTNQRTVL